MRPNANHVKHLCETNSYNRLQNSSSVTVPLQSVPNVEWDLVQSRAVEGEVGTVFRGCSVKVCLSQVAKDWKSLFLSIISHVDFHAWAEEIIIPFLPH